MPKVQFLETLFFGYRQFKKGEYAELSYTQYQLLNRLKKVRLVNKNENMTLERWAE